MGVSTTNSLVLSSRWVVGRRILLLGFLIGPTEASTIFENGILYTKISGINDEDLLKEDDCECTDEKGNCFEPVCPKGYFRCCYTCQYSTCAKNRLKEDLVVSNRGVLECLPCREGDVCVGCDEFAQCPLERRKNRFQQWYYTPRISPPKIGHLRECLRCPPGAEADLDFKRCVDIEWRDRCDLESLAQCMEHCKPSKNPCDQMACRIYCAKQVGNECLETQQGICEQMNIPTEPEAFDASTSEPTRLDEHIREDSGVADIVPVIVEKSCNLNCNCSSTTRIMMMFWWGTILYYYL